MRRLLAILALGSAAVAFIPTSTYADAYGTAFWCTITTTGLPGGTVNHRLAIGNLRTDPVTGMTAYGISGVNLSTNADSFGYGHSGAGNGYPITLSWTDSPTIESALVRHWHLYVQANLATSVRITDVTTTGISTATTVSTLQCNAVE